MKPTPEESRPNTESHGEEDNCIQEEESEKDGDMNESDREVCSNAQRRPTR